MNKAELKQKFIDDYTPNDFDRLYPTEIEANKVFLKRLDELLQLYADKQSREEAVWFFISEDAKDIWSNIDPNHFARYNDPVFEMGKAVYKIWKGKPNQEEKK